MMDRGTFDGLVFSVGSQPGSARFAGLIQQHGGVVINASQSADNLTINRLRSDEIAMQLCIAARRPVLHFSWILACVEHQRLVPPSRGTHVSVPPGYHGPLVVGGDGQSAFPEALAVAAAKPAQDLPHEPRGKRRPYTNADHEDMVEWALHWHDLHGSAGLHGNKIWREALAAGHFQGRSVDSLQSHFRPDVTKAGNAGANAYHSFRVRLASRSAPDTVIKPVLADSSFATAAPCVAASERALAPRSSLAAREESKEDGKTHTDLGRGIIPRDACVNDSQLNEFAHAVAFHPTDGGVASAEHQNTSLSVAVGRPGGSCATSPRGSSKESVADCESPFQVARAVSGSKRARPAAAAAAATDLPAARKSLCRTGGLPEGSTGLGDRLAADSLCIHSACGSGHALSPPVPILSVVYATGDIALAGGLSNRLRDWGGSPSQELRASVGTAPPCLGSYATADKHQLPSSSLLNGQPNALVSLPDCGSETLRLVDDVEEGQAVAPTSQSDIDSAPGDSRPGVSAAAASTKATVSLSTWLAKLRETYHVSAAVLSEAVRATRMDGKIVRTVVEQLLQAGFGSRFGALEVQATLAVLQSERREGADSEHRSREQITSLWVSAIERLRNGPLQQS